MKVYIMDDIIGTWFQYKENHESHNLETDYIDIAKKNLKSIVEFVERKVYNLITATDLVERKKDNSWSDAITQKIADKAMDKIFGEDK